MQKPFSAHTPCHVLHLCTHLDAVCYKKNKLNHLL